MDAQVFLNDYMSKLNPQAVQEYANVQQGYDIPRVIEGPVSLPEHRAGYKPGPRTGAEKMVDLPTSGLLTGPYIPRI